MLSVWHLTVKERILLHLLDCNRFEGEFEVPGAVTQDGIAEDVGIRIQHVNLYVKPLISEGLVKERVSHIKQKPRRRKTYFLTYRGKNQAISLRGALLEESVPFRRRRGDLGKRKLSRVLQEERRESTLLELWMELKARGYVSEYSKPAISGLVEALEEAPFAEEFYGRQAEIAEVLRSLDTVPVVVITGMAGVGKSTLGAKVCESLRGKRSLFWRNIRAWDTPADLIQRLAGFLKQLGRAGLYHYVSGPGERETSRIEDLLASDLAEVKCLLVLDDVQNASNETQEFLALLARVLYPQRAACALVLSRTIPRFYGRREVVLEEGVAEMTLGGLDLESSRALLQEAGYDSRQLDQIVKTSAGTPLFLKLLARSKEPGPGETGWEALEDYIAEEIEPSLGEEEHGLLETASFHSGPVPEAGLLLGGGARRRTAQNLQKRGLLERSEAGGFALHDFLRDYFQRNMSPGRRTDIIDNVIPWLHTEAQTARTAGRPQDAISYMENAILIEFEPQRRIMSLELLGRARRAAGDELGALSVLRSALQEANRDRVRARLHREIALSLFNLRKLKESEEEIELGLKLLPSNPNLEAAWLLAIRANIAFVRGDFRAASRGLVPVVGWIPELPEDLELTLWVATLDVLFRSYYPLRKEWRETGDEWRKVFELAKASFNDPQRFFFPLLHLTLSNLESGEIQEVKELVRRTVELGEATKRAEWHALALLVEGWYLSEIRGDYESAEAALERSFALFNESPATWRIPWYYRHFADLYRRQGRFEEARESLEHFLEITPLPEIIKVENLSLAARLCVEGGDVDTAKAYLQEAMGLRDGSFESAYFLEWAKAAVKVHEGNPEGAKSSFERALTLRIPSPTGAGNLVEVLASSRNPGELLLDFGRFLIAEGRFERAEGVLMRAQDEFQRRNRRPREYETEQLLDSIQSSAPSTERARESW